MTPAQRKHYSRVNITEAYLKIRRSKRPKYLFMTAEGHLYPYAIRSGHAKTAHANKELKFVGIYSNVVNKRDFAHDIKEARK